MSDEPIGVYRWFLSTRHLVGAVPAFDPSAWNAYRRGNGVLQGRVTQIPVVTLRTDPGAGHQTDPGLNYTGMRFVQPEYSGLQ
jgi:hypothetical protein